MARYCNNAIYGIFSLKNSNKQFDDFKNNVFSESINVVIYLFPVPDDNDRCADILGCDNFLSVLITSQDC